MEKNHNTHADLIQMYAEGKSTVEIAIALNISTRTVEKRVLKLRKEYGATHLGHLIAIYLRREIIQ